MTRTAASPVTQVARAVSSITISPASRERLRRVVWKGRPRLPSANLVADIVTLTKSDYVTVSSLPLSLNSRIGLLRKRRRNGVLKQVLAVTAPVIIGVSILLLVAAVGVVASAR